MGKKLPDTPDRLKCRRYEEKHKDERKEKHKGFNAMLYRYECEEMERYCIEHGFTKAEFMRYAFELVLEADEEYECQRNFRKNNIGNNAEE